MKKFQFYILLFFSVTSTLVSSERKLLLEMFTNAHCYSCIAAYEFFRQYSSTDPLAYKTSFVFYHIAQPGVEDSIYFVDKAESDGRNNYYGPYTVAPLLFMDGTFVGTDTPTWQKAIASRYSSESPFEISITGTRNGSVVSVEASIKQTGDVLENDLRIYMILTESVETYIGKNGVTPQVYAMRKMMTGAAGETFSSVKGGTKKIVKTASLNPRWIDERMYAVVFVQSASKKNVYQSEMKSLTFFSPSSVGKQTARPNTFSLEQSFPNPFNPSASIRFTLESEGAALLRVTNTLGETVATLVDERLSSGEHTIQFNGSSLASGVYFYSLEFGGRSIVRTMMLVK